MAVKWGILSTADINKKLLAGAAETDDVEVVAVGSRTHERAEEFAQEWDIPRAYGTYEELLADPEIEAIYNPLPNTMHSEWSIKAMEAGKHVLCEKPFSRHIGDVERAFDAADTTGMHLSEAFMYRHHPQTARLAELVASGAIGELRVIRSVFSYSLYDADNIRLRTDVEGGSLMDVGSDWVFAGMMRFPGDVVALFDCGTSLPNRDELEAIGTEGSLFLDDPWHCGTPVIELRRNDGVERIEIEAANPYRLELEDLNAAIRSERQPLLGREDAMGQVRAIDALFRSHEAGGAVVTL